MDRKFTKTITSLFLMFGVLVSSVPVFAASSELNAALLQEDFKRVRDVAIKLLSSELESKEEKEVKYYLGLSLLRLGQFQDARDVFKKLDRTKDKAIRDKANLGLFDSYYLGGQYVEAADLMRKLLRKTPRSEFLSLFYLKAARVNLKLAKWNDARIYLRRIINEFPKSLEAHTAKQLLEEKQYFAVQVGAFVDQKRAETLVNDLKRQREYAYIVETIDRDNQTFYRVRVGQMTLLNEAQRLKTKLSKLGYPTQIYP